MKHRLIFAGHTSLPGHQESQATVLTSEKTTTKNYVDIMCYVFINNVELRSISVR